MLPFLNSLLIIVGFAGALFGRKEGFVTGWRSGYLFAASGIFFAFGLLLVFNRNEALLLIVFGFAGMILEAIVDFLLKKIQGERLFAYKHLTIFGYGSILSFPFWGVAGIIFWRIGNLIV